MLCLWQVHRVPVGGLETEQVVNEEIVALANAIFAAWRVLRAGQAIVVLEAALGGVLDLMHHKAPGLHVLYGVLPLLVAFIAEQLRLASAQMVLDARGYESAQQVGELPEDEQQSIVVGILHREVGVMTLSALVVVGLLARAAGTA